MPNKTIPMETNKFHDEFIEHLWFIELETEKGKDSEVGKSLSVSLIKYADGFPDEKGKCFVSVRYEEDGYDHDVLYGQVSQELFDDIMGTDVHQEEALSSRGRAVHPPPNLVHAYERMVMSGASPKP